MAWKLNEGSDRAIAEPKEKAAVGTHDRLKRKLAAGGQAANMGRRVGDLSPSTAGLQLLNPEEPKMIGNDDDENPFRTGMPMNEFSANSRPGAGSRRPER